MDPEAWEDIFVELATWSVDEEAIQSVREAAGIDRINVGDADATHLLTKTPSAEVVGAARLTGVGEIDQMAVLDVWRGHGVELSMVRTAVETATSMGLKSVSLAVPEVAVTEYQALGFEVCDVSDKQACRMTRQLVIEGVQHRIPVRRQATFGGSDLSTADAYNREFYGRDEYARAVHELIAATERKLLIYTHDLERGVLGQPAVVDSIAHLANHAVGPEIRIIVHEPNRAVTNGHLLLPLAQRKPGVIDFRLPGKDYLNYLPAFIIGDDAHCIFREVASVTAGELWLRNRAFTRPVLAYFNRAWDFGEHDQNLRALNL